MTDEMYQYLKTTIAALIGVVFDPREDEDFRAVIRRELELVRTDVDKMIAILESRPPAPEPQPEDY